MNESTWKGMLTGMAGGLVAWWAVDRLYRMARNSSNRHALAPYCVGAALGAAYGALVVGQPGVSAIARVPLGAAVYLADPEKTAPPHGGKGVGQKAGNTVLRLASHGLKMAAERALFA